MKSKLLISYLALALVLFNCARQAQANAPNDAAVQMLKEFYTKYITEITKTSPSTRKLNSIRKQYCTAGLLSRIKEIEMDEDPFLNAQDADDSWLKTLSVSKDSQKSKGVYVVSFLNNESKEKITARLLVVKDGDDYKIDGITFFIE